MTSFTDETMGLANVYAESLLRVAKHRGLEDEVAAEIHALAAYMDRNPPFAEFMTSAALDDDDRSASLEKIFRGNMSDLLLNTLQVLNRRRRSELVPAVARAVELKMQHEREQQEITVETAAPLSDDLRTKIKEVLSKRLGREAIIVERVEPRLIGGIIVHVGDQRLDASLLTQVRGVRDSLTNRAIREIYRSDGHYVVEN